MGLRVGYQEPAPSGGETELLVCPCIKLAIPLRTNSEGWFFKWVSPCAGRPAQAGQQAVQVHGQPLLAFRPT
jgi:hypothetical protein